MGFGGHWLGWLDLWLVAMTRVAGKPAGDDKKLMKELGSAWREEGLTLLHTVTQATHHPVSNGAKAI